MGAFYMMVGFNNFKSHLHDLGIKNSSDLTHYLLKTYHIALLPGSDFYFNESSFFCRLAFVDFNGNKLLKSNSLNVNNLISKQEFINIYLGIDTLKKFVKDLINDQ